VCSRLEKFQNLFRRNRNNIKIVFDQNNLKDLSKKINDCLYNLYLKDNTGFGFWCDEKTIISNKNRIEYFSLERAATGF
jgi:hypothetical protein